MQAEGLVSARTGFPGGRSFSYVVESSPASVKPAAFFSDNIVTVRIPETAVLAWATSEQVSIDGDQVLDDGEDDFAPFVMYLSRGVDAVEEAPPNKESKTKVTD